MGRSLKNYTTIRSVLSEKEWSARSLRICFLLMPWHDAIEVTDELLKAVSDQTVMLLAQWLTRIVTTFGLDPEGDLCVSHRVGWSGLDIPAPARPYIYPASQLRDKVRALARSASVNYTAIAKLAGGIITAAPTPLSESSKPYSLVLQQFGTSIQGLAAQQAPAKDLLALCDQLRDAHLWNLGILHRHSKSGQCRCKASFFKCMT